MKPTIPTHQWAMTEAERCLFCFDAPCTNACPSHIDIPKFITMLKSGNIIGSAEVVKTSNALANVCGKVCPEEIYCQSVCNRGSIDEPINIRDLHFFVTQEEASRGFRKPKVVSPQKKKVAVIGGGPTGLSCAFELSKLGYSVTVYDAVGLGGVPSTGIPSFRLPDDILQSDIQFLSEHFTFVRKSVGPRDFVFLQKQYDAVFLAVGLGEDKPVKLEGENHSIILPVLEFLRDAKKKPQRVSIGNKVVIIGGGNVSLDAAATAKRLGATDVILLYRRSELEMKVWKSELEEARRQGIQIQYLTVPVKIIGTRTVKGIVCRKTRLLKKKDSTGRQIPEEIAGSDFTIPADSVIAAIGQVIKSDVVAGLSRASKGFIAVNKKFQTSMKNVFAGGDAISGEGTIVQSVGHGKQAAHCIDEYLSSKKSRKQ